MLFPFMHEKDWVHSSREPGWVGITLFLFIYFSRNKNTVDVGASFPLPYRGRLCGLCTGEGELGQQHW